MARDLVTNRSGGDTTSDVRRLALEVLGRIERDGAYANLALRTALWVAVTWTVGTEPLPPTSSTGPPGCVERATI
ncbi:MAG: hypothetical protein CM1200mP26_27930 [Acidimicrobiales bacterium]|nr:MAG: hypothetical protein CM1200mP26_27930 [Acidimicrobiales bacterium]